VRDATGQIVAWIYARASTAEAMQAKVLTMDEARRVATNMRSELNPKAIAGGIAILFGLLSALFWRIAATRPVPVVYNLRGRTFLGDGKINMDEPKLDPIVLALKEQAKWNMWAAACAAVASLAGVVTFGG
jgi:hypothetical protein